MPKQNKPATTNHRTQPYSKLTTPPMYHPATPPDTIPQDRSKIQERSINAATTWLPKQDEILIRARQQGENWQPIATKYFPEKSANACRKRHERLMERRNTADSWDTAKLEKLAIAYNENREQMWKVIGHNIGEKWQVVEAKCMEKGLKNLQNAGRNATKRSRGDESNQPRDPSHSDYSFRSRSLSRDLGSEPDNGLGPDHSPFLSPQKRYRVNTNDEDRHPFSAGFHTPSRTFSGSTSSISVTGMTPTVSAAPTFPFFAPSPTEDTQPRPPVVEYQAPESNTTLPSFGELVGHHSFPSMPSLIAEKRLPRHPPHSPSYRAPVTKAH